MHLTVNGKQMDVGDALRSHIEEKLEDMNQKYFNHATDATVTLSREGHGHGLIKAHIHIRVGKNIMVMADGAEADAYASFDKAADKVGKQLRRYKNRLRDHHERMEQSPEVEITKARDYVLAGAPESDKQEGNDNDDGVPQGDDPVIIAEMTTDIQTMSVSEAVMRMDLGGLSALLFRNASHNGLNMVYRRPDGNVGWVDPSESAKNQIAAE